MSIETSSTATDLPYETVRPSISNTGCRVAGAGCGACVTVSGVTAGAFCLLEPVVITRPVSTGAHVPGGPRRGTMCDEGVTVSRAVIANWNAGRDGSRLGHGTCRT